MKLRRTESGKVGGREGAMGGGGWGSVTQCRTSCDGLRQGDLSGVVASITIRDRDKADKE